MPRVFSGREPVGEQEIPGVLSTPHSAAGAVISSLCLRQGVEQHAGGGRDVIHGLREGRFVGLGWLVEAAQLAHELQGSRTDLIFRGGRLEVEQRLDAPAHGGLQCSTSVEDKRNEGPRDGVIPGSSPLAPDARLVHAPEARQPRHCTAGQPEAQALI